MESSLGRYIYPRSIDLAAAGRANRSTTQLPISHCFLLLFTRIILHACLFICGGGGITLAKLGTTEKCGATYVMMLLGDYRHRIRVDGDKLPLESTHEKHSKLRNERGGGHSSS